MLIINHNSSIMFSFNTDGIKFNLNRGLFKINESISCETLIESIGS